MIVVKDLHKSFGENHVLCGIDGEGVVSGPEERRGAAPFVCSEDVHLASCPSEDTGCSLGNLLLPEGSL